jgi:hypothetical protein
MIWTDAKTPHVPAKTKLYFIAMDRFTERCEVMWNESGKWKSGWVSRYNLAPYMKSRN